VEFLTPERRVSLLQRFGELAVPTLVICGFALAVAAVAFGLIEQEEAKGLILILAACVGGVCAAVVMILSGRRIEAPDHQRVPSISGWFRFGSVGGVGGAIGVLSFIVIALLRAPMFAPVLFVSVVLGLVGAVVLRRVRVRSGPPTPPSIR